MINWDFFIAHASADLEIAEELYEYLRPYLVFLDSRSIDPSDDWDNLIPLAQNKSLITIAIISSKTKSSYYERSEIATAISLTRKDPKKHKIVPIFLSDDITYGLNLKQGIKITDKVTLEDAADILIKLLLGQLGEDRKVVKLPDNENEYEYYSDDIILNVSAYDNGKPPLFYITNYEDNKIKIERNFPYLTKLDKEGPIEAITCMLEPFSWDYPCLDLKVVNNSNKTIFLTDAVLDIKESIVDPLPILKIDSDKYHMHYPLTIHIINNGWGSVRNLKMKFNLTPIDDEDYNISSPYKYEVFAGSFINEKSISVAEAFKEEGVDVEKYYSTSSKKMSYQGYQTKKRLYLRKYQQGHAIAYGELEFNGDTLYEKISYLI